MAETVDKLANKLKRQRTDLLTSIQTLNRKQKKLGTLPRLALQNLMQKQRKAVNISASTCQKNDTDAEEEDMDDVFSIHEKEELDEEEKNLYKVVPYPTLVLNDEKDLLKDTDNDFNE